MPDLEKVIKGLEEASDYFYDVYRNGTDSYECEKAQEYSDAVIEAIALLKEQDSQLMTLEEVIAHYSLPPVFVDDFNEQEDFLEDIKPLYFDYLDACPWYVHWRGYCSARTYIGGREASYGVTWRCWTDKPTDEQRKAVKWDG